MVFFELFVLREVFGILVGCSLGCNIMNSICLGLGVIAFYKFFMEMVN